MRQDAKRLLSIGSRLRRCFEEPGRRISIRLPGLFEWAVITRATVTTRGTIKIRFWIPNASEASPPIGSFSPVLTLWGAYGRGCAGIPAH